MSGEVKPKKVAVIGGGLVGSLNTCFLAKRGFQVDVYERRSDIRIEQHVAGKSINLALSHRGREALKAVGLEEFVCKIGIPMHARMIHSVDGSRKPIQYGKPDQFIMSVDRRKLNEIMLTASETNPNVTLHFNHKLVKCNFTTGQITLDRGKNDTVTRNYDLICGCDGAFSAVRREMMKQIMLDYQQEYIPHGYMELCIPPTPDNKFAMEVNFLHIWPRNEYMMIALPNLDCSYTTTLFMPFEIFNTITSEEKLMKFFHEKFPDSIPLLGEENLKTSFMSLKALPMMYVKCSPYHVDNRAVLLGDAAHAMVPFYGQGMNAGFEDCLILDDILEKNNFDFAKALPEFTEVRNIDSKAIVDLALYNYIEMRSGVNSPIFLLRKKLDNFLYRLFPKHWIPLYTMVSFTRTRYHHCIARRKKQDQILSMIGRVSVGAVLASLSLIIWSWRHEEFWNPVSLFSLCNSLQDYMAKLWL